MNPLQQLAKQGQSIWLDFISRELVTTDRLRTLIEESNVTGLTSNPTIFQKAMAEGTAYDAEIRELLDAGLTTPDAVFWDLAIKDIQAAADAMRPVFDRTKGGDGFVSLEVAPSLANDTEATVAMAADLWKRVDRPNLMIKIPATPAGIPAIERTIAAGINVNVTLIFALESYRNVVGAYMAGLEQRHQRGESLDVHSVASFFVSRVDTETDRRLQGLLESGADAGVVEPLLGTAAIANAVLAYELFEKEFRQGERWKPLGAAGAHVQRPLWASTSAKNPKYRDVVYAEALVGPDTVDTMPPETLEAFGDHGRVEGDTVRADYPGAHDVMERLATAGISIDDVTDTLLRAGVASFAKSFDDLLAGLAAKLHALGGPRSQRQRLSFGTGTERLQTTAVEWLEANDIVARVWSRDTELWKPGDEHHSQVVRNRLGWLTVVDVLEAALPRLTAFNESLRRDSIRDVVVLGMGGSSLCPEVLRSSFEPVAGSPRLHVLDTTDPAAINALGAQLQPRATVFLVASKSGSTLETLSHFAHFWAVCEAAGIENPSAHFVAITDSGSGLEKLAQERGFRETFVNPSDIGGRYSALSYFGMVPAAAAGLDVAALLASARAMLRLCDGEHRGTSNPGAFLGAVLGQLHDQGRDKVTIVAPPAISAFSLWAEQLIAESTGKEGTGLIPIGDEPLGDPQVYAHDRVFVVLQLPGTGAEFESRVAGLRLAGQPVIELTMDTTADLGGEFFRWEFATAVAGAALHIDPFDEPNVQESKDNTNKVLADYERSGTLPVEEPSVSDGDVAAFGAGGPGVGLATWAFLEQAQEHDYVAIMAYLTPDDATHSLLQEFRVAIRDRSRLATTLGFGPRFLHSTGQLHKGGPNSGVYVQLVATDTADADIPGKPFSFSVLKQAQADGDLASLRSHGRRVMRVALGRQPLAAIRSLTTAVNDPAGASER